ncbi:hypothetical protein GC176_19800 [bacterium]|nr:hypothetical protein [bacterium]
MARLLYGNFDFEHELATPHYNRPQRLARVNAALTSCLNALADPGDQIWFPEPPSQGCADELTRAGLLRADWRSSEATSQLRLDGPIVLEPWGWSAAAVAFARQLDVNVPSVDLDAVRQANSRTFSFALEESLGVAPPGSARLESSRQLLGAVTESDAAWRRPVAEHRVVLKAEFGMSGRERIVMRGDEVLTPSVHGWINRRVEQSGAVYLEPWLDRVAEFSTHWDILPDDATATFDARVCFVGRTQLLNTLQGQYFGSRVGAVSIELRDHTAERLISQIETTARRTAVAVAQLGYIGPLGIDAMIDRDVNGELGVRAVQDINARWSMGRIALALQTRLAADGCLSLLRVPSERVRSWNDSGQRGGSATLLRLTPDIPEGQPGSEAMAAVFARSPGELFNAEEWLTRQQAH